MTDHIYKTGGIDMNDIDLLKRLFTAAANDAAGDSRIQLFRALDGVELFYSATEKVIDGKPVWSTPVRMLGDGTSAMFVFTSKVHPDLPPPTVGAQWSDVLTIAYESVRADWLVLVNYKNETVAVSRKQIPAVAAELRASPPVSAEEEPVQGGSLDTIISDSVQEGSGDWYDAALRQLRGRELFLFLNDETEGQPSIRTSPAGGRDGWLLSFTTRSRPDIKYGGIVWEALVELIKNDAAIPGVRVVNDADDWILLGRDVI